MLLGFFFFNDTATTEIYTLSLHDALPICGSTRRTTSAIVRRPRGRRAPPGCGAPRRCGRGPGHGRASRNLHPRLPWRSEEHTSELQSRQYLVCRLLLEKKNKNMIIETTLV